MQYSDLGPFLRGMPLAPTFLELNEMPSEESCLICSAASPSKVGEMLQDSFVQLVID